MESTIKAPPAQQQELGKFWQRYFAEIPTCSCEMCAEVAVEVDPFFPYLDDLNRCRDHRDADVAAVPTGCLS